jgi:gamma-glutamyltranspeptidase/glutathione hydrolase
MDIQQAIDAPRVHHQWIPDLVYWETFGLSPDTREKLEMMGHVFRPVAGASRTPSDIGDAHGVMIDATTGMRMGASDPRLGGVAIGF